MKTKQYLKLDEKAVAPVIGVVLLVATTVMLSTVIGAYTFGFSDKLAHSCDVQSFTDGITGNTTDYTANTTDTNTTDTNTTDTNETAAYDVTVTATSVKVNQLNVYLSGTDAGLVNTMSVHINGALFLSRDDDDAYAYPASEFAANGMVSDGPAWNTNSITRVNCMDITTDNSIIGFDGTDHVVVVATFTDGTIQTVFDATV